MRPEAEHRFRPAQPTSHPGQRVDAVKASDEPDRQALALSQRRLASVTSHEQLRCPQVGSGDVENIERAVESRRRPDSRASWISSSGITLP